MLSGGEAALTETAEDSSGKADWKARKEEQSRLRKRENQIQQTEEKINDLEQRLAEIDGEFAKPEVATNSARLGELHREQTKLSAELEELYIKWENLSES